MLQLKKASLTSNKTVAIGTLNLDEVADEYSSLRRTAEVKRAAGLAARAEAKAARSLAESAAAVAASAIAPAVAAPATDAADAVVTNSKVLADGHPGGDETESQIAEDARAATGRGQQAEDEPTKARELDMAAEAAEAAAELAEAEAKKAMTASDTTTLLRVISLVDPAASSSGTLGRITAMVYFTGGDANSRTDTSLRRLSEKASGVGFGDGERGESDDDEDDEEEENDDAARAPAARPQPRTTAALSVDKLPRKCPHLENRAPDYAGDEYFPNEVEAIVVSGKGLRTVTNRITSSPRSGGLLLNRPKVAMPYVKLSVGKKNAKSVPYWKRKHKGGDAVSPSSGATKKKATGQGNRAEYGNGNEDDNDGEWGEEEEDIETASKSFRDALDIDPFYFRTTLPAPDVCASLTIRVYEGSRIGATFLGRADLPLKAFFDKKPQRLMLELKNNDGLRETRAFGFLDVVLRWRFNKDLPMNLELLEGGANGALGLGGDDDDDDDDDYEDDDGGMESTEAGKAKAAEDLAAAIEEQMDSTKVSGFQNYTWTLFVPLLTAFG